jgi:hypothetical protein
VNLITPDFFISQMTSNAQYFQLVTPTRFSYPLEMMRETTQANQLICGLRTNFHIYVRNDTGHLQAGMVFTDSWLEKSDSFCSPLLDRECKMQTAIYTFEHSDQSLLLSPLSCLYNQLCIDSITILVNPVNNFKALSRASRFFN